MPTADCLGRIRNVGLDPTFWRCQSTMHLSAQLAARDANPARLIAIVVATHKSLVCASIPTDQRPKRVERGRDAQPPVRERKLSTKIQLRC